MGVWKLFMRDSIRKEEYMQADRFLGRYVRFETPSKRDAAMLLGADNLVGDAFEIVFRTEEGTSLAWLQNRFGSLVGYFDEALSRELRILDARGWKLQGFLSLVVYSDDPKPGCYWGEVALLCYDPRYEAACAVFAQAFAKKLAGGTRLDIELGEQGFDQVISSNGSWLPKDKVPLPQLSASSVIMKSHINLTERLIEESRKGNKGCYAATILFFLALIGLFLLALKSCGVF